MYIFVPLWTLGELSPPLFLFEVSYYFSVSDRKAAQLGKLDALFFRRLKLQNVAEQSLFL